MRPFPEPLAVAPGPDGDGRAAPALARLAGPVTYQGDPQAVLASESLAQALRQVAAYGRDGLPVLSGDGQQVQGWITGASVLDAVAREIGGLPPQAAAGARPYGESSRQEPPNPLPGYQVLEVTVEDGSPASGKALGAITWPPGSFPLSVLRNRRLQDAGPSVTLTPGDRINLLARAPQSSVPPLAQDMPDSDQDGQRPRIPGTH
jgi:CIC family chloride channel protein